MPNPACRLGDQSNCPADSHGNDCCSHNVTGPTVTASPDVFINGKPALRVGDTGIHSACGRGMKTALAALAFFISLLWPGTGLALDAAQLSDLLGEAFGDDERTCAVIKMIDREISARPDDERLRKLRIAGYGALNDPYPPREDVDFLAALHPDSAPFQLQKCLYAEATGTPQEENRLCYLRVAELCRQQGKADAHSHEYMLALLLAEATEAEEAMRQFLATLSDSPMDQTLKETLANFSREQLVRRVDPSEIRHRCPREQ